MSILTLIVLGLLGLLVVLVAVAVAIGVIAFPELRRRLGGLGSSFATIAVCLGGVVFLLANFQQVDQTPAQEVADAPEAASTLVADASLSAHSAGQAPQAPQPAGVAPAAQAAFQEHDGGHSGQESSVKIWLFLALIPLAWIGFVLFAISRRWPTGGIVAMVVVPLLLFGALGLVLDRTSVQRTAPVAHYGVNHHNAAAVENPFGAPRPVDSLPRAEEGSIPVELGTSGADRTPAAGTAVETRLITRFKGGGDDSDRERVQQLPEWVNGPSYDTDGEAHTLVLSSRFSDSPTAAQEELARLLATRLTMRRLELGLPVEAGEMTLETIHQTGLIAERVREESRVRAGEFNLPVFRESWLVRVDERSRQALAQTLLPAIRMRRIVQLNAVVALLALIFGSWAAYFQIDDVTRGRYRTRLKLAAAGVVAVAGFVAVFLVRSSALGV